MLSRFLRPTAVAALAALALTARAAEPAHASAPSYTLLRDTVTGKATVPLTGKPPYGADDAQPDTEIEPSIAVNPANPLNAVTVFQEDRIDNGGDADNGFATTFDGGQTWTYGYLPGLTTRVTTDPAAFERASDAVAAFGPDDTVYASSLVFDMDSNNGLPSGMAVNESKDGGRTWGKPVFLEQDNLGGLNDKNWIVVDTGTGSGHHTGRVYVFWDRVAPMVYAYCDPDAGTPAGCDNPANWTSSPGNNDAFYVYNPGPGIDSYPFVEPDGSVGVVFEGDYTGTPAVENPPTDQPDWVPPPNSQIMFAEAKMAGSVPFPAPLTFDPAIALGVASNQSTCCAQQRAGTLPAAAVDPKTGQIYVTWEDTRLRGDGLNDVLITTSTDGVTWSPATRVSGGSETDFVNHFNPTVAVDDQGVVHVAYRQRVETKSGLSNAVDTYWQESTDHGLTWTPPLKLNTVETDARYGAFSRGGLFEGDYDQVAAGGGYAYITRDEAYASYPGEPCNCSFTSGNGHQHQYTWVAVVSTRPSTSGAAPSPAPSAGGAVLGAATTTPFTRGLPRVPLGLPLAVLVIGALLGLGGLALRRR